MTVTIEKKIKRAVNGILLLDKAIEISSNSALQRVKHLFHAKKAGHTGSLDPLASGMLPLCFGEATKFSQYLLDADKTYLVKAKLGVRTTTSDLEGEVVSEREVPAYDRAALDRLFDAFRGQSKQMPSMFSALKYQGKPLYKLARQGISVERPIRSIYIYSLRVIDYQESMVEFELCCSKGTYVRTLVDDFGEHLGCGAHVVELRRLAVGAFKANQMHTLETLQCHYNSDNLSALDTFLLPMTDAVAHMPNLALTETMAYYFRRGEAIQVPLSPTAGMVALQLKSGEFIGIGEVLDDGRITPKRLVNHNILEK